MPMVSLPYSMALGGRSAALALGALAGSAAEPSQPVTASHSGALRVRRLRPNVRLLELIARGAGSQLFVPDSSTGTGVLANTLEAPSVASDGETVIAGGATYTRRRTGRV